MSESSDGTYRLKTQPCEYINERLPSSGPPTARSGSGGRAYSDAQIVVTLCDQLISVLEKSAVHVVEYDTPLATELRDVAEKLQHQLEQLVGDSSQRPDKSPPRYVPR